MIKNKAVKLLAFSFILMSLSMPNLVTHDLSRVTTVNAAFITREDSLGNKYLLNTSEQVATLITSNSMNETQVTINDVVSFDGITYKITTIEPYAFESKKFSTLIIGSNLERICTNAFNNCTNLKTIIFKYPNSSRFVENFAFMGCPAQNVLFTNKYGEIFKASDFGTNIDYITEQKYEALKTYIKETSNNYMSTYISEKSFDSNYYKENRFPRVIIDNNTRNILDDHFYHKMAHNIYSDPLIQSSTNKYDTFSIDFRGVKTPPNTYWALCTFRMDLSTFGKNATGGGAYAGLQNTPFGRKAIMSFWEIDYKENGIEKKHRAQRVYPKGTESNFGGEGEGNNFITDYEWEDNKWYRMVLRSWNDAQTKNTMVGQWIKDVEKNQWKLISYFDMGFKGSSIMGSLSQFQENYSDGYSDLEREFNIKNMYCKGVNSNNWLSLKSSFLSSSTIITDDTSKKGKWDFGAAYNYFWGKAGGRVTNQFAYNEKPNRLLFEIAQSATPSYDILYLKDNVININEENNKILLNWDYEANSSPQFSYKVTIFRSNFYYSSTTFTKPEARSHEISGLSSGKYNITITITDIFGQSITKTYTVDKK